tara:strand:+ start:151 stop:720 length:570 start_codon:yes stop_codon:yes gene_type:complete
MNNIKIEKFKIKGLLKISPKIHHDNRGYFFESYNFKKYSEIRKNNNFILDCHSFSKKNILRGIHFQYKDPQSQLFYLVKGSIFLVVVDFRPNSKTFLNHQVFNLKSKNHEQIFTPPGLGSGFYSYEKENHLIYKISRLYKKKTEIGVKWNDINLSIKWPCRRPIIGVKDKNNLNINQINFSKYKDLNSL